MNKLMNLITKLAFLAVAFSFFIIGCGDGSDDQVDETAQDTTTAEVTEQAEKLVYPLPTPLEITKMLNDAGASYILDITNKPEEADKYFTEAQKALNLGVYGADLSYSATYNKSQETMDFFACTKKLRDKMDIQTPFNEDLTARIESNIENKDSLYAILTNSFKGTFEYLNENNNGAVSVLVLAGGWIEGLYLSAQLASYPTDDNSAILQGIADQKESLDNLIGVLGNYKDNQDVAAVQADLVAIQAIYAELKEVEGKLAMTDDIFKKIDEAIKALRKKIVEIQ